MSGFITMQRAATEHHLFNGDAGRLGAWIWLVAKACWKPTKFNVNGKTITLERGQFCCSVRDLAEAWGWSKSTVDRFLTRLKNETMIRTDAGTGRLVITICNYEKYQDVGRNSGTPVGTAVGTVAGQQRDIKEQGNQEPNGSMGNIPPTPHRDADWPEIPAWVPADAWNGWLEMRRRKRDWPTARAITAALKKLSEFMGDGHDPGDILDTSTLNNWTGIFKPKAPHNGQHHPQANRSPSAGYRGADRRDGFQRALDRAGGFDQSGQPAGPSGQPDAGDGADDLFLTGPG